MNGGDSNIEKVEKRKLADSPTDNEEVASKIMKQDDSSPSKLQTTASPNHTNNSNPQSLDDTSKEEAQQKTQAVENNTKEVKNGTHAVEVEKIASKIKKQDDSSPLKLAEEVDRSRSCPYLDTINRKLLDFDFEKLCSISLSHLNVYACLVCGKYFQGRGRKSHAYTHSVETGHHVFLNLFTLKFYCLPDNYEIIDPSLEDITYLLNPTFSKRQIKEMKNSSKAVRAYDGTTYLPGIVGLNNIKANDYCNVLLQALSNVPPLRNYYF